MHWTKELSSHNPSIASDGRRIVIVSGFMTEEDHEIRQSIRDQDMAAVAAESRESRPPSAGPESRRVGGRRIRMARGMTVDSGAADNVIPRWMNNGKFNRIRSSKGSRAGTHYVSASSARISNEGECDFHFTIKDGQDEVTGLDVSRIINKKTGKIIQMTREHNVWTIDAFIEEDPDEVGDFGRRGYMGCMVFKNI